MRKVRGNGPSSRVERRRYKANHWLNWAIGIVSLLILAIGCIILISVFHSSSTDQSATPSQSASSTQNGNHNKHSNNNHSSSDPSGTGSGSDSRSDNGQVSNDAGSQTGSSAQDSSSPDTQSADESHQASYDIGSPDWNAQVQAISEATRIPQDSMTIHWLGNGGSPNSSLARVSPRGKQSSIYVVHLVYRNGHWQADNVKTPQ
ncbi:DUF1510 family protein [Sporolactobacillus sp. THM7-4]|nr:DUF1510 family protein [Sporolactobacillus sp. THM7-4]